MHQQRKTEIIRRLEEKKHIQGEFASKCVEFDIDEQNVDEVHFQLTFWDKNKVIKQLIIRKEDFVISK